MLQPLQDPGEEGWHVLLREDGLLPVYVYVGWWLMMRGGGFLQYASSRRVGNRKSRAQPLRHHNIVVIRSPWLVCVARLKCLCRVRAVVRLMVWWWNLRGLGGKRRRHR